MVRREIKNFELMVGEASYTCSIPCSVKSVLSALDEEISLGQSVSFDTDIYVDDAALAMRNFYLRVKDIRSPAEIFIGERLVARADGKTPVYNINASGLMKKGNNTLSIRFSLEDVGCLEHVGLTSSVDILRFSGAIIDRVMVNQNHTPDGVKLDLSLDFIGDSTKVRAVATLTSSSGQIYYAGLTGGKGSVMVKDPLYWSPKAMGVQNLYRLGISLYGESDIEDNVEMRLGLRSAEADGKNIKLNGLSLVPYGAIYLPDGTPDIKSAEDKANSAVTSAAMSGYNCLVIPLGAPTPCDKFYELCDIHGIMVIEEHATLDDGVIESLRYRSSHPSLCLIDLIGEGDRSAEINALSAVLPNLSVRAVDDEEYYVGANALPSMKTIRAQVPEDERSLFSRSIESIAEEGAIREMLLSVADRYPYPSDLSAFAYASALASAHKVGDVIKRSRMSSGRTSRAIFDRLNDNAMAISASAVDVRGRWKPLQYYVARHFSPVAIYADFDGEKVEFSVSCQRRLDLFGRLEYRIADAFNETVYSNSLEIEVSSISATKIHSDEIGKYIHGHESEYYLEYLIKEGDYVVSRKTMLFVPEKHFKFKKPQLKTVITGNDRRFSITVASDVFVKDMEIDFDGVDVVLENNYFDMTTDGPIKINFTVIGAKETAFHLKDVLQTRSVVDLR